MVINSTHGWRVPEIRISRGQRMQAARREAGLTGERMAELLGVSRRTISRWESDDSAPPAVVISYSMATEANLGWLQTGVPTFPDGVELPRLDSNQQPIGSRLLGELVVVEFGSQPEKRAA